MVEQLILWALLILSISYAFITLQIWTGLSRLLHPNIDAEQQKISIIVAARNEEKNIGSLLQSLIEQQYPSAKFEILIVNDRSTDSTATIAKEFSQKYKNIHIIDIASNNSDLPHKKNALNIAIKKAQFDILAFTDADCLVPKHWLNEISKQCTEDVGAVAGYSPYITKTANSFLRYEEFKNSMLASSAIALKNAFLCTGRNFVYRKRIFEHVGGFEKIKHSISGDDDLFLQLIQRETDWNIRYMVSPESYVHTFPPQSFSQFIHQRIRHISASKYYPKKIQFTYSLIHIFHAAVIVGFFFSPLYALIALMGKFNLDGIIIAKGKEIFHEEFSVVEFFFDEILLVLYSFFIAPLGLIKNFIWKGAHS